MSQILTQDHREIASQLTEFSAALFKSVGAKVGPSENVLISPFSVAAVLVMTHFGAKGITANQLKDSLGMFHFPDEKIYEVFGDFIRDLRGDDNSTLNSAYQMYADQSYPFKKEFQRKLTEKFEASPQNFDFISSSQHCRMVINNQVEELTKRKIKGLIPEGPINTLTRLVLVTALYFKGNWLHKFNPKYTKQRPFYLGSMNNHVHALMMCIEERFRMGNINELDAKILELPYKGKKLSMFIVLPNNVDGLPDVETKLAQNSNILDKIDELMIERIVTVHIPKLKIKGTSTTMKECLIELGIKDLFSDSLADLPGISSRDNGLYCSDVFHKCLIEINEKGNEEIAGDDSMLKSNWEPPCFVVNHPAILFIRDNNAKLIIFIGRLSQPYNTIN